ncbi:MAG: sensor histidine kinase [Acidobacteriota bacterium]
MGVDRVAELLRREQAAIVAAWEIEVRRELPVTQQPDRPVLREHAYPLLSGIAAWIEGAPHRADHELAPLPETPALQALGYAAGLKTMIRELGQLRGVILRAVAALPEPADLESRIRLHEAIDRAIELAVSELAQRREDARDRFIGILGHDLRDPIGAVTITARVLGRHPRIRSHAERIEKASQRMMRMVDDLLDFARGHLGAGIPARPAPQDLGEISRVAADEVGAAHADRAVAVELHGDLHANVDRDRAVQALENLVSNAIQHGTGPVELVAAEADDHEAIVTSVTSHGPPIPPDALARIFEPFASGEPEPRRAGRGLGLYIVQLIARAHGATVEVSSNSERTVFSIRWPRARVVAHRKAS